MSVRCEPPEELRGVDGWHWLTEHNPVLWIADWQDWEWGEDDWVTPEAAYRYGYRYLAPVATPAEVAALRAELKRLREALERIANHPEANVVLTDYGPDGKQRVWTTVEQEARAALAKEMGYEG